ncbi:putative RNA recognition motif domain, nucleotide-binding alpha-beta plait domain superfamily [Helianthus anomalus]
MFQVASVKVIRNKQTGFSERYGFVEFYSYAAAEKVLQTYTSIAMPNTEQPFRLNSATFSMGDKRSNNGWSKGYGFVRFGDDSERTQAMTEMNGTCCSSRPMCIGAATPRKSSGYQPQYGSQGTFIFNLVWFVIKFLMKSCITDLVTIN